VSAVWAVPAFAAVFLWIHSAGRRATFPGRPQAIAAFAWSALSAVHLLAIGAPGVSDALWLFANAALLWEWSRIADHRCPGCGGWGELGPGAGAPRSRRCTACGAVSEA
jgi:hypothetical protein